MPTLDKAQTSTFSNSEKRRSRHESSDYLMACLSALTILLIMVLSLRIAQAISPDELAVELQQSPQPNLIDVRHNALYQKSHIPNAINIPASLIARKKLPPLGRVIVYGDGIHEAQVAQAVSALNQKRGLQAEALSGGYTAWQARHNTVQQHQGLDISHVEQLTYQQLQTLSQTSDTLLLVDLRADPTHDPLSEHFPDTPHYRANSSALKANPQQTLLAGLPKDNQQILILIDDGNGLSETIVNKLNAAGVKRVAILVGGQHALQARGQITQETRQSGD